MKITLCNNNTFMSFLADSLKKKYDVYLADNCYKAKSHILDTSCDIILSEIKDSDENMYGIELLKLLKASKIATPFIMIANKSDISLAVECVKEGATDFIEKSNNDNETIEKIHNAIEDILKKENVPAKKQQNKTKSWKVLFVDDNEEFTKSLLFYFNKKYTIDVSNDFVAAQELIKKNTYDCIFLDINDETSNDNKAGISLLEYIINIDQNIPVIMLSGWADTAVAVECLKIGANDFLEKSLKMTETIDKVDSVINKIIDEREAESKDDDFSASLFKAKYRAIDIIGESNLIKNVRREIIEVANHDVPVLICGETGTGKEMVASSIHIASPREKENFIELDCSSIPEAMFESELFGSAKGAYTGSVANRKGKMELAHNGTLFLDEIENLSLEQQAKLLRVLEDKKIYPLGSNDGKIIDFRLICATNIDLHQLVEENKFREDLFYRLNVYKIELPPLRERGEEDIFLLLTHFLDKNYNNAIEKDALELLKKYNWPGNVRELKNLLKKFEIIARTKNDGIIDYEIVKEGFKKTKSRTNIQQTLFELVEYYNRNVPKMLKDFEDMAVLEAYKDFNCNISKVAQHVYREDPHDNKNHRERVRKVLERNKDRLPIL